MRNNKLKRQSRTRREKFTYSVPDEVLEKLVDLFRSWGIREGEWLITMEHAFQRYGYPLIEEESPHEIDIVIRRRALPWLTQRGEWTCLPPVKSPWFKGFQKFVDRTGFTPHLSANPQGSLKSNRVTNSEWYRLPSKRRIRIDAPRQCVRVLARLLASEQTSRDLAERAASWRITVDRLQHFAMQYGDAPLLRSCRYFYRIADRIQQRVAGQAHAAGEIRGRGMGTEVIRGRIRVVRTEQDARLIKRGEVIVTEDTNLAFLPFLRGVLGVVTDRGGLTSHAATLAWEFGIPAVIGTKVATKVLKIGDKVEVDTKHEIVRKLKK